MRPWPPASISSVARWAGVLVQPAAGSLWGLSSSLRRCLSAASPAIAAIGCQQACFVRRVVALATNRRDCVSWVHSLAHIAAAGLLYPTQLRSKGVGWALAIGRWRGHCGTAAGRPIDQDGFAHAATVFWPLSRAPWWWGPSPRFMLVRLWLCAPRRAAFERRAVAPA